MKIGKQLRLWEKDHPAMPGEIYYNEFHESEHTAVTHVQQVSNKTEAERTHFYAGLVLFHYGGDIKSSSNEVYYYMPFDYETGSILLEKVQTVLDVLRAGGVPVADDVQVLI
jgi:hypothetical protein